MKRYIKPIIFHIFLICFLICIFNIGKNIYFYKKDSDTYAKLLTIVEENTVEPIAPIESSDNILSPSPLEIHEIPLIEDNIVKILPQYEALANENSDFVAWIKIENTDINYPVMQTVNDEEYYLKKNFYGEYSTSGTPFIDADCVLDFSDNIIIYGHNMKNGTMFASLENFASESFWDSNKLINFNTLYKEQSYEIVYAFYEDVSLDNGHFRFYEFISAENEEEYNEFILSCKELSIYNKDVSLSYGDKLLTLVTCSYNTSNERFVIVAKMV